MFQLKNKLSSDSNKTIDYLSLGWLLMAIVGMLIASIYALLLVGSRAAGGMGLLTDDSLFRIALVLHVDFSLLVWFLAIAGLFWNMHSGSHHIRLAITGYILSCFGALLLAVSPLIADGEPVLSDYVLVIHQPVFLSALAIFAAGLALTAIRLLLLPAKNQSPLILAVRGSAWIYLAAMLCLPLGWWVGPVSDTLRARYEDLFWGAGHLLQIGHTMLMLAAVLVLIQKRISLELSEGVLLWPLRAMLLLALIGPLLFLSGVDVPEGRIVGFTHLMAMAGVLASLILVSVFRTIWKLPRQDNLRHLLLLASGLFLAGMWLGVLIDQNNARVPAHYHGAIGGITLVFMGLVYQLTQDWYGLLLQKRLLRWQVSLYASGLVMLIAGLVIADVPRKTVTGTDNGIRAAIGHSLAGIGGTLALIGSLLFLWLVLRALFKPGPQQNANTSLSNNL